MKNIESLILNVFVLHEFQKGERMKMDKIT